MGTGPGVVGPNVQLYGVLGLRERIGETTDANRVYSRSKPHPKAKRAPTRPSASAGVAST